MKSILVIDTPKSCMDCEIFNHEELCCLGCKVNFGELSKVQSWCPLKPMPQKKNTLFNKLHFEKGYANGWNDCLKEILGE